MPNPYTGASTAQFYVAEVVPGVTPANPQWLPLRSTGGIPAITREAMVSAELGTGRETSSIRTGNEQVTGEYAIELSRSSQDDLLASAMASTWVDGPSVASLQIAVDATAKTFTRSTGDFTTSVEVGDLVAFKGLAGDNGKPFIVTGVSPLVITAAGNPHTLVTASAASCTLEVADKLETGDQCKTVSILTWFKGKCGGADAYVLTKGVEFTGFSIEQAVNAMVTGSFPFIGLKQEALTSVPSGSVFTTQTKIDPFSSVDVAAYDGSAKLRLVDSFTITNDNSASAQFELGTVGAASVSRGLASNTFSLSGKLFDMTMMDKFIKETQVTITSLLVGPSGAMSFTLHRAKITAATPEISGPTDITLSIEGQATGDKVNSSITIQRLTI